MEENYVKLHVFFSIVIKQEPAWEILTEFERKRSIHLLLLYLLKRIKKSRIIRFTSP